MSSSYPDLEHGATSLVSVDPHAFEGVLVGGTTLSSVYPQVLRYLAQRTNPPLTLPVAWAGDGFEWCFGSIAFPSEAVDADIFLFHHWDAFSGMKEHILAKIDIFDETRTESFERILAPNETIFFA